MFLVSLDILSKLNAAVLVVVDGKSGDNGAWVEHLGDTKFVWKRVQPEHIEKYHFNDDPGRIMFKWGDIVCSASPFFYSMDAVFDVWSMLILSTDV